MSEKLSEKDFENAVKFMLSGRGKFVMNEVIAYGLNVMESLPDRDRSDSNIRDIKFIKNTIFKWK